MDTPPVGRSLRDGACFAVQSRTLNPLSHLEAQTSISDLPTNGVSPFDSIRESVRDLYLGDPRPWLIGFSGGKDSTMLASLIFEAVLALPPEQRTKPISVVCTDTRVEIPRSSR